MKMQITLENKEIKAGIMTIDDAPERWREAVKETLDNDPE